MSQRRTNACGSTTNEDDGSNEFDVEGNDKHDTIDSYDREGTASKTNKPRKLFNNNSTNTMMIMKRVRKVMVIVVVVMAVRAFVLLHARALEKLRVLDRTSSNGSSSSSSSSSSFTNRTLMKRTIGRTDEEDDGDDENESNDNVNDDESDDEQNLSPEERRKIKRKEQKQKEMNWAYEKRKQARDNRKKGQEKEYAKENEDAMKLSVQARARVKQHGGNSGNTNNGDELGDDNNDDDDEGEQEQEDGEEEEDYAGDNENNNKGNWAEDSENPEDANVETFEPTQSKGGSFDFSTTKFAYGSTSKCESWNVEDGDGPQVKIKRAVWIQTHGNNTSAQLKAAELNKKTGQRQNAADNVYRSLRYHHAPSLARLPNGGFVSMWHASPDVEGERSQHIRVSTSDHNGKSWSNSFKLKVPRSRAQWNPVIHIDSSGRVYVFYSESEGDCIKPTKPPQWPPGGSIKMTYTEDSKITEDTKWATPKTIYSLDEDKSIPKMVSSNLVVLDNGKTWALPIWREHAGMATYAWPTRLAHCRVRNNRHGQKWTNTAEHSAGLLVSEDNGETWTARGYLEPAPYPEDAGASGVGWSVGQKTTDLMDGSLFQSKDEKRLSMYFKTTAGAIYGSDSEDNGHTWTEPLSIGIDAPESKTLVQRLYFDGSKKGPLLMAYNAHKRSTITNAVGKEVRLPIKCITNLLLSISPDDGKTWVKIGAVRGTTTAPGLRFHSPSIVQSGCKLFVAYSKLYARGYQFSENDKDLGIRLVHINM